MASAENAIVSVYRDAHHRMNAATYLSDGQFHAGRVRACEDIAKALGVNLKEGWVLGTPVDDNAVALGIADVTNR